MRVVIVPPMDGRAGAQAGSGGRGRGRSVGTAAASGALAIALLLGLALPVSASTHAVKIRYFTFTPDPITVHVGDSVTWTNGDSEPHTATALDASFDTGQLNTNQSGTVTFSKAGTIAYYCSIHPDMKGSVDVLAATAPPATDTDPGPSGDGRTGIVLLALAAIGVLAGGAFVRRSGRPTT